MGTLPDEADVVVIGAGHNGLVCAAYLAAAGLQVAVLEARPVIGGNTVTEELTLPGFAHDSCSSAHVLIQSNPLLADDELGLLTKWGLEYVHTDPAVVLPQADGRTMVIHRDLEATADEISQWSADDAAAFRKLLGEWAELAPVHGRWSSGLPLGDSAAARAYRELRAQSAWNVVHERFQHPAVRDMMLWLSLATIQDPRRPGTGVLPSSIASGRLRFGWSTPIGGSGALPAALMRLLEAHGGSVVTAAPVSRVEVRNGRAVAVETTHGQRVQARRAVVTSSHLARLPELLTEPAPDIAGAADRWRSGLSVFAVHAALKDDLSFAAGRPAPMRAVAAGLGSTAPAKAGPLRAVAAELGSTAGAPGEAGPMRAVAAGLTAGAPRQAGTTRAVAAGLGSTVGVAAQLDAFHRGEVDTRDPWLLVVNQTVVDPSRRPAAGGGTFKILTIAPWELADGRSWSEAKQEYAEQFVDRVRARVGGLEPDNILAIRAESPVDVAQHNIHNLGGSCHGGEFLMPDGEVIPGWPSYDTSVEGLFLTGSTSHPGGSVSGRPGRNTARAVLRHLGLDPAAVMSER